VALREPVERGAIESLVGRFFHALETEDADVLGELFAHDAISLEGGNWFPGMMQQTGIPPIVALWRSRFESRDVGALRGLSYVQYDAMDRETTEDVTQRDRTKGALMRAGDELVRIPIATPRGAEGILGTAFLFLVRRTPEGLKIAGLAEENSP